MSKILTCEHLTKAYGKEKTALNGIDLNLDFGAFVEIAPGKEGLVHISKLDTKRVERVEDVVAVGDAIVVKVTDIDQQGRINLSRRDAILALEAKKAQQEQG